PRGHDLGAGGFGRSRTARALLHPPEASTGNRGDRDEGERAGGHRLLLRRDDELVVAAAGDLGRERRSLAVRLAAETIRRGVLEHVHVEVVGLLAHHFSVLATDGAATIRVGVRPGGVSACWRRRRSGTARRRCSGSSRPPWRR